MSIRVAASGPIVFILVASSTLFACGGEAPGLGPQTPLSGPLASLHASRAKRVNYTFEGGKRSDVLVFDAERVHVSAGCADPSGQLRCQAIDALRAGKTVQLAPNEFGGANPGAIACRKMGKMPTTGRAASGDEDGFCEFPDGSFVSTGSIDAYCIK